MAANTIELRLTRVDKVYRTGDVLRGVVLVRSKDGISHNGIYLQMDGSVSLQLSAKNVGLFEAFYNSIKPVQLINLSLEVRKPGKLPAGKTEIPFELPVRPKAGGQLYETYHGVFVNIQYTLRVDMKRSAFSKDLGKTIEFLVNFKGKPEPPRPVKFTLTPASLENVKDRARVPDFMVEGTLDSATCIIDKPLSGELIVRRADVPIKSIELQLVRVETCGCLEGYAKDPTEIQNIQIADGDVARDLAIPMHMRFPRLFTCPTLVTDNFKVEFELNIVIVLSTGDLITENFPIKLVRY